MDGDNRIAPHLESQELRRGLKFPSSVHSVVMTSREIGISLISTSVACSSGLILAPSPMLFADVFYAIPFLDHPENIFWNLDYL
jgi:hypothetical protein